MNLPVPIPPTDNLYKFMAVFGLVLGVVAVVVPLERYDEYERLKILKDIEKRAFKFVAYRSTVDETPEQRDARDRERKEADERAKELSAEFEIADARAQRWLKVSKIAGIAAAVLMIWGFLAWFFKVQKHRDKLLEDEAKKTS